MQGRGRFWPWLAVWTVLGLGIRIGTVIGRPNRTAGGDPYVYFNGARLLLEGHGFINPVNYLLHHHQVLQSAAYAPGYMLLLTVPMIIGFKSFMAARVWSCLLGAAGIIVGGLAGREISGRRVGLIAAFLIAVFPNMWMSIEFVGAETIEPLVIAAVLLFAYKLWKRTDFVRVVWFGAVLGVAMLCRDELALLVLFVLVPMCLLARALTWRRRFAVLGVGLLTATLVIGPWVGYNMARFSNPTFISDGEGITMASANCAATFSGKFEGYWFMPCAINDLPTIPRGADESAAGAAFQHDAVTFMEHHANRLVPVGLAKVGRAFGLFHPLQQISFDSFIETRPYHWALLGLGMYYVLAVLSIGGTVILYRRKIPVYPLWAVGLNVVFATLTAFGNTRYRLPFDVCLVMMGSVTLAWAWEKVRPTRASVASSAEEPPEEPPVELAVPAHV